MPLLIPLLLILARKEALILFQNQGCRNFLDYACSKREWKNRIRYRFVWFFCLIRQELFADELMK